MTEKITAAIKSIKKENILVAIDGRCGSGKTTLAAELEKKLLCNVIHLDSFFLRPCQKTARRLSEPGGNIDYERFTDEVLLPLSKGVPFSYRPYVCKTASLGNPINIVPRGITLAEGTYSCHPKFWNFFDLHIFLDIEPAAQLKRITLRESEAAAKRFRDIWIPLEEKYFKEYNIKESCELKF